MEGEHHQPSGGSFIAAVRFGAAVVNGELFEIGQDRKGQLGRPGITAKLKSRADIFFDVDGGFLGFDKEFARAANAESVIGGAWVPPPILMASSWMTSL